MASYTPPPSMSLTSGVLNTENPISIAADQAQAAGFPLTVANAHTGGGGMQIVMASTAQAAFGIRRTADTQYRVTADSSGALRWGPGGSSIFDTNLYRLGVARVGTDYTFRTGVFATGSRPTPAAAGVGGQIYDTTLSLPIWSDGTAWRNSDGVVV